MLLALLRLPSQCGGLLRMLRLQLQPPPNVVSDVYWMRLRQKNSLHHHRLKVKKPK